MANYKTYVNSKYTESDRLKELNEQSDYWGEQQLQQFQYDDFATSDRTNQYQQQLDNLQGPGEFNFSKHQGWDEIYNKIINRQPFSYDVNGDALYQQYKDQYVNLGKMASADVMGQAAAMTGGYGNSYAQSVGQQAYQGYLQQLTDKVPELYQLALSKYNSEGDELYKQHSMYADLYNTEYDQYRDAVGDYQTNRNYLADRVDASTAADLDLYNTNRDTAHAENESYNKIISDNRSYYADIAQELANLEWGKYTDTESITAKAYEMYNDNVYKAEQTRIAEAELAQRAKEHEAELALEEKKLAESQRQYNMSLAKQQYENTLDGEIDPVDYATWDGADWHTYFSYIRQAEGEDAALAELDEFNQAGLIPQEHQAMAASGARGGYNGH